MVRAALAVITLTVVAAAQTASPDTQALKEESLKTTQNPAERKTMEDWLANEKPNLERTAADEQRLQSREIDAETQLRAEQTKLADLQDQLDRLDKLLDSFTRKQP
jgi:hypothetical protein